MARIGMSMKTKYIQAITFFALSGTSAWAAGEIYLQNFPFAFFCIMSAVGFFCASAATLLHEK